MIKKRDKIRDKIRGIGGIVSIGSTDITGALLVSFLWLFLPTVLTAEEYGEIHYILSIAGIGFVISMIGTRDVITVFTAKSINLNATFYFLSIIFSTTIIIILTLILKVDSLIIILAFVINELGIGYLLGRKMYRQYPIYVLTQKSLSVFLGISFYFLFGIEGILFGLALSYSHFVIIIYNEFKNSKINLKLLKSHRGFIISNYTLAIIGAFRSNIDKIIIVPMLGLSALGNYALAMQVFAILMLLSNIVFKYILPHDAQGITNYKIKISMIFLSIGISIFGIFISPMLIPLFFPNFTNATDAIQIISIAIVPATIGQILMSKLLGKEKSKFVLGGRITSMSIMMAGIFILGPIYEIQGISMAFLLSSIGQVIFLITVNQKYLSNK